MQKTKRDICKDFENKSVTAADIMEMDDVPVEIAAKYLGKSKGFIMASLRDKTLPIGAGTLMAKRWVYHISPGMLVAYKTGKMKIEIHVHDGVPFDASA